MDVVTSRIDGLETARLIHIRPPGTTVSVYGRCDYAQQAQRAGAVDYLLKPVRPAQLEASLSRLGAELDAARAALTLVHVLRHARPFIAAHDAQNLSLTLLARQLALSQAYLYAGDVFCPFTEYLTHIYIDAARHLLRTITLSLAEISVASAYHRVQGAMIGDSPLGPEFSPQK
jgi:YesN/AraC family two-component response regulator